MITLPFASFAPGVNRKGVGYLYYAFLSEYANKLDKCRCKVHFLKKLESKDGLEPDRTFPIVTELEIERVYTFPELDGRVLIAVPATFIDNYTNVNCVEFDFGSEVVFMMKRSGTYTNPYRPEEKIVTEAEVVDEPAEPTPRDTTSFNSLLMRIIEETEIKDKKEEQTSEELDLRQFVVPPTSPFIFFPKNKDTPAVPFWLSYKQWMYYDRKFEIGEGKMVLARQAELDLPQTLFSLYRSTKPESEDFVDPSSSIPMLNFNTNYEDVKDGDMQELYLMILAGENKVMDAISPKDSSVDYYKVDKGQMYACVRLHKPEPTDCPLINLKSFRDRYRVLGHAGKQSYSKVKLHVQLGEVVGLSVVPLGAKDYKLVWGTDTPVTNKWIEYHKALEDVSIYMSDELLEKMNQERIDSVKTSLSDLLTEGIAELPYTIEFGEYLQKIITHPLLFGRFVYEMPTTTGVEEGVMLKYMEATGVEYA